MGIGHQGENETGSGQKIGKRNDLEHQIGQADASYAYLKPTTMVPMAVARIAMAFANFSEPINSLLSLQAMQMPSDVW